MWKLIRQGGEFDDPELMGVEGQKVYLGRVVSDSNHRYVVCCSPVVSRKHCLMEFRNGDWFICDLKSLNGTYINENAIQPSDPAKDDFHWIKLSDGDLIGLGVANISDEGGVSPVPEGNENNFVFKFNKMRMPTQSPRNSSPEIEEIVIASSDDDEPAPVRTPVKAVVSSPTSKAGCSKSLSPSLNSVGKSKGTVPSPLASSSGSRPGPLSWKNRVKTSPDDSSSSRTKRKVEDASPAVDSRMKKRRKSEDEIPSSSKKFLSPKIGKKEKKYFDTKPAKSRAPKIVSSDSSSQESESEDEIIPVSSKKVSSHKTDKKKTRVNTKSSKTRVLKAISSESSSQESDDDFDDRSRSRKLKSYRSKSPVIVKKAKLSASKRERHGRVLQYSEDGSDEDEEKEDINDRSSDESRSSEDESSHRFSSKNNHKDHSPKVSVSSCSVQRESHNHRSKPRPRVKRVSIKLRRALYYSDGAIRWHERVRRRLSPRQIDRIERQLLKYHSVGTSETRKQQGLKGSSSNYNQHVNCNPKVQPKSKSVAAASPQYPPTERYRESDDPPVEHRLPIGSIYSDDDDSSHNATDEESPPEEPIPEPMTSAQRKAILIEPPAGAFAPKRRSKNQNSFPPPPAPSPRPRGLIDPAMRKKKLQEIALKKKEEKARNMSATSTSTHEAHNEAPKVKVTSRSRFDLLASDILQPTPAKEATHREAPPLPDKQVVQQMPLSIIEDSMKSSTLQPVKPQKTRQAHAPRGQPSMKKLMHKGATLDAPQEIPGTSKSFVTNGTRMDGPPRRLQEERAIDRKAPIDLELPYHEILRWNPKWLEEVKNQKENPAAISTKAMVSTLHEYESYDDYVNIFYPLIINEFWASLVQEYSGTRQNRARHNGQHDERHRSSYLTEFKIGIEGVERLDECPLISDQRDRNEPRPSRSRSVNDEYEWCKVICHGFSYEHQVLDRNRDLGIVTLHFNMPDEKNPTSPRIVHRKLFCFIYFTGDPLKIDCKTEVHRELFGAIAAENNKISPTFKTNFHLIVKLTPDERNYLHVSTPGDLKKIMHVGAKLRDFKAMLTLGESRLFEPILKPSLKYPLFNPAAMKPPPSACLVPTVQKELNGTQRIVVHQVANRILANYDPEVMLLHGPPGTGKTLVIVSLIAQLLKGSSKLGSDLKILVCTPSNTAIDEIIVRVDRFFNLNYRDEQKPLMVRLGNEDATKTRIGIDRLAEQRCKQPTALRSIIKSLEDHKKMIRDTEQQINDRKRRGESGTELQRLYRELETHKKRCRDSEEDMKKLQESGTARPARRDIEKEKYTLLREANIIFSTLSSCAGSVIHRCLGRPKWISASSVPKITCCIIDEATQTTEPESLAPTLLDVNKLFLVGDPNQLPATVISQEVAAKYFGDSLFTRHYNYYKKEFPNKPSPVMFLEFQYRMHPEILLWPNKYFYGGKLKTTESVAEIIKSRKSKLVPYVFINLEGEEVKQSADGKISNSEEVKLIVEIMKIMSTEKRTHPHLRERPWTVGIVTPYKEQKKHIYDAIRGKDAEVEPSLLRDTEVDTVDSFQGREKDVMILSCVRSQALGFLTSSNRLCVALTRARQSLIVIGNALCLNSDSMWKELMDDATRRGLFKKIPTNTGVRPGDYRLQIERAILEREERSLLPDDPFERAPGVVTSRVPRLRVP